ncbi:ABC transporter ATP-binding protein [Streptomyces sp. CA2R106]|uniref:ABC transporter ATP-binding protein n=1 Tax=Streptomyces sp. CA2R106 TaxID=3120153 RepID=UPI003007F4F8
MTPTNGSAPGSAGDTSGERLLVVENLHVAYQVDRRLKPTLHDVSFSVAPGEVIALVGESGSGKTTTGHAVLGLLPANGRVTGGRITFRDQVLTELSPKGWRALRGRAVSLIPQDPTVSLDPLRRVGEQVEDTLLLHSGLSATQRRRRVHELFETVGFRDVELRYRQYPHELSGGMKQRVLIASAIAGEPDLIIADEPTSGLDATVQKQVLDLIGDLCRRHRTAVVLVTHDLGVAADRADRIGVMERGRLVEVGTPDQIFTSPRHPYTKRLVGAVPGRGAAPVRAAAATEEREPVITVTDLRKSYGGTDAVAGTSFEVRRGETFSIVGESGSGKSTTARVLVGLMEATSGSVSVLGTDITGLDRRGYRPLRKDVQIVHQNPYSSFDPRFDVFDVVEEPLRAFQPAQLPWKRRKANRDRVVAALEAAALPPSFADLRPAELSGGQRQRVALARALVVEPKILVLDEPISALDVSVAAQILDLLGNLQRERGLTYVFISHDLAVVRAISDHVAVMQNGRIVEQGPVDDVFSRPSSPYTQNLLGAIAGRKLVHL